MKEFYCGKKILITGHTGFKGSWLTRILVNWGATVVGVSLPPDTAPNLFETLELAGKIKKNYFTDIRDFNKIKNIFEIEKPEIVFHLAAQPIVRDSYDDPLATFSTNIIGTANILQAIKEAGGVKSAVIITTDKVYENKEQDYPYKETDALGGYDPYSASKAAADIVTSSYIRSFFNPSDFGQKHDTLVAVARAGNVIGGGDWARDRLIPDMVRAIFERKESVIIRNPKAVRPWQHVLEPLGGYLLLGKKMFVGHGDLSGAWNFGPGEDGLVRVEELVEKGISILQQGVFEVAEDASKHEANLLKLDASKAGILLDWHPKWSLTQSLEKTFSWYEKFYGGKEDPSKFTDSQIAEYFGE
ncbi:MAG: CDP-glucose 4,6-dehydratase [Patescibacteria group bacterium]|nr:CDP-glucose 4,6-dehydratase [Patescibacteria group bacterium]